MKEMYLLVQALNKAAEDYYSKGESSISDREYDLSKLCGVIEAKDCISKLIDTSFDPINAVNANSKGGNCL